MNIDETQRFKTFLEKDKLYKEFEKELIKSHKRYGIIETFNGHCESVSTEEVVASAFFWNNTKKPETFWVELEEKWLKFLN